MIDAMVVYNTKENALVPRVDRLPCPFYGFVGMPGMLVDNEGNACGLAGGHRPCAMEMNKETPSWKKCQHFNHGKNHRQIDYALDNWKIFPNELHPPGTPKWEGVSLRGWFQLITHE